MPTALADYARRGPARNSTTQGDDRRTDSIDCIWNQYRQHGTDRERNQLISHYMQGHVRRIAERMRSSLPGQVDVDDLTQQGYMGLVDAIERFDADRGVKFETFSSRRIYGAMQDYLRSTDPVPRLLRSRGKKLRSVVEDHRKRHGCDPDPEELSERLDMPEHALRRLLIEGMPAATVSFNGTQPAVPAGEESDAMDGFEDHHVETPVEKMEKRDLCHWLIRGFDRRDRLIVILYYYESMTMKEIGGTIGCSESRVSQRLDCILSTLKSRLDERDMEREFFK